MTSATVQRAGASATALVTGAANGIGKAIVVGLLKDGYRVVAVDRDGDALDRLQSTAARRTSSFHGIVADLADFDPDFIAQAASERFGHVDILINNAGVGQAQIRPDYHANPPRFYEVSPSQWDRAIAVNATAVFLLSRSFVPGMANRGWGRVINITTSLGTMLRAGYAPYGPSKASAEALSAVMAGDLHGTGVTVNVVTPGGVVNTALIPDQAPFSRDMLVQPQVMVPPVQWLCSRASDGVTGQRYLGINWDPHAEPDAAARLAGAPIGWKSIAALPVTPS
jgi:NAD(P)-dependent dehydrogenase (short-subunit alcohol dehydrogenase family)